VIRSLPLCSCDFPVALHQRPLHLHPICAPGTSCSGCVGWFFETVIGRILDLGCRIETVVGFLCMLLGCTTYPAAHRYFSWLIYQLVTLFKILREKIGTTSVSSGIRSHHCHDTIFFTLSYIYFCLRPVHKKSL
jgi:hypothetical protein